jgi:hypothetical protein
MDGVSRRPAWGIDSGTGDYFILGKYSHYSGIEWAADEKCAPARDRNNRTCTKKAPAHSPAGTRSRRHASNMRIQSGSNL